MQNGNINVAPVTVAAGDAVHIVDETERTQEPAGVTADSQQEAAAASTPLMESEMEEEAAPMTTAAEAATNGSTVTMEV